MAKMNWGKAGFDYAKQRYGYEEKYDPGTVLPNGRVVAGRAPPMKVRGPKYKLTPYDRERMGIKPLAANPPDIALHVLEEDEREKRENGEARRRRNRTKQGRST